MLADFPITVSNLHLNYMQTMKNVDSQQQAGHGCNAGTMQERKYRYLLKLKFWYTDVVDDKFP